MKRNKLFNSQGAKGGLSRKGRKAISSITTPRLLTISDEDRQQLLSSRMSNILEEKTDDFNLHLSQGKKCFDNIPKRLDQYREKDCPLWKKATTLHDHEDYEPHEHQELAFVKQDGPTATESHCDDKIKMDQDADDSHHCCCCRHREVEYVRSVQEIAIQTEEEIVIVKKLEERGVQTEPESSHVARETSDMEKDEDQDLMGVRHEERSFEYLEKSYNYEYNEDMNKCFDKSSESVLFESSFNDKVFANKLIEKSSKKKRRRTWSEKSYRVSAANSSISSNDSSIFVIEPENINCNEDDTVVATNTNYERNNDNGDDDDDVVMIQDDNNDDGSHNFASWKHSSHHNDDDNKATDVLPLQSVWNTSCDDDFFANLPNDEELFNLPPTSPTGGKRCISSSTPNLEFHRGQPGIRNISVIDSPFSSMGLSPIATINSNVNSASKPKKQVRKRSTVLQSKETITNERDKDRTPTRITKMSKSARPRGKTLRLMNDEINPRATAIGQRNVVTQSQKSGLKASKNLNCTTPPTVSSSQGDTRCSNHTPMLNYSLIDTPILKKELKRYGLKPFPRTKAKILLRHIYKETHK